VNVSLASSKSCCLAAYSEIEAGRQGTMLEVR
jgi:hypothetical protein